MGIDPENQQLYQGSQEQRGVTPRVSARKLGHSRISLTIQDICDKCNRGWMHDLEDDVQPVLTPMIEGRIEPLSWPSVAILNAWAVKTALNFACFSKDSFTLPIEPTLARQLYAGRAFRVPVPGAQVWTAMYRPLGEFAYRFMAAQGYGTHPITGHQHQVVRVVFLAGHATFYVRLPDTPTSQRLGWQDPLAQFVPFHETRRGDEVTWSMGMLSDTDISITFNRHIHAALYPGQGNDVWHGLPPSANST